MPPSATPSRRTLQENIALMSEEMQFAWIEARHRDKHPFLAEETRLLARHGSGYAVHAWQAQCLSRGDWSDDHVRALWLGLAFRDTAEDADAWQQVMNASPFAECVQSPLWPDLLSPSETLPDIACALSFVQHQGAASPSAHHPVWKREDINAWMGQHVLTAEDPSRARIIPQDAGTTWWLDRLDCWMRMDSAHTATQMHQWVLAGLPLQGPVLDLLRKQPQKAHPSQAPWWSEDAVSSALQGHDLDQAIPQGMPSRSRRF